MKKFFGNHTLPGTEKKWADWLEPETTNSEDSWKHLRENEERLKQADIELRKARAKK